MNKNNNNLINIIGFQLGWWGCVIGASMGNPYLGPLIISLFLIIHYRLNGFIIKEICFVILIGLIGTVIDSVFQFSNILIYKASYSSIFAPLWITFMWMGFAATINYSMAWLNKKYKLAFLLGLTFGPLSYITGEKFNAINFNQDFIKVVVILGLVWAFIIPILYCINNKFVKINEI